MRTAKTLIDRADAQADHFVGFVILRLIRPCLFQSRYVGYFSKVRYDLNGSLPPKKYLKIRALTINAIKGKADLP